MREIEKSGQSEIHSDGLISMPAIPGTRYSSLRIRPIELWLGSGLLPGERAVEAFLEPGDETRRAQRPAAALAGADRLVIGGAQPLGEKARPVGRKRKQRAHPNQLVVLAGEMRPRARPAPVARAPRQPPAHRLELDIARAGQQIGLVHRTGGEAALP